jgi:hypothetical protein
MKTFTVLVTAFSCVILVGCGTEPIEDGDEALGEAVLDIGETTCATAATADDEESSSYCGDVSSISPDGSYGQTNCPGQYVVEFSGQVERINSFDDGWGDTLPSQTDCPNAHSYVTAWEYVNGAWQSLGNTHHVTGTWSGGACYFANPSFDPVDANATLVRVASRAVQCTSSICFAYTVKKARAYVFGTACL